MKNKYVLLLVILSLCLSISASVFVCYKRMKVEAADNSVEMVADYTDIERLSVFTDTPISDILSELKDSGITSIALTEDLAEVKDSNILQGLDPKKVDLYIPSKGLSKEKIKIIEDAGLKMIPRIRNSYQVCCHNILERFKEISKYGMVIFAEEEVMGYPNFIAMTADAFKSTGLRYGYVEFGKQLGDSQLASYLGGDIVKVHSIPFDEMEKMTKTEIIGRYLRGVRERSIRVLYVHLLQFPEKNKALVSVNKDFISQIRSQLIKDGFTVGEASKPPILTVGRVLKKSISIGVGAGTALLLGTVMDVNFLTVLVILLLSLILPVKYVALTAAIIFPSYALISQFPVKREQMQLGMISKAVNLTLYAAGITAVGSIMIASLLADKINMIGIDAFSGIKLAFIIPIMIVAAYFFFRDDKGGFNIKGSINRFYELLSFNITFFHVILLFIFAAAGALLILRSGNFGVPVPGFEKTARDMLEKILVIRPRTKEFLIGYPALILAAVYYFNGGNRWLWLCLAVGMLAPISLTNSFCHIHTPLTVSIIRSCIGLVFGIAIGLMILLAYKIALRALAAVWK